MPLFKLFDGAQLNAIGGIEQSLFRIDQLLEFVRESVTEYPQLPLGYVTSILLGFGAPMASVQVGAIVLVTLYVIAQNHGKV